ncbi:hypothetical protein DPMN_184129 [Dreissena polymorpha]|uniref:Uncharacterized protein n=1 Tax=Dreissena polymorpha TaxID=45954 RepID=A0A9D4DIN5_DREPO|nr:hypothetical protein DPMN_184129 [Dreissena polymorpha]
MPCCYYPPNDFLITGGADGKIKLFNGSVFNLMNSFIAHHGPVTGLCDGFVTGNGPVEDDWPVTGDGPRIVSVSVSRIVSVSVSVSVMDLLQVNVMGLLQVIDLLQVSVKNVNVSVRNIEDKDSQCQCVRN